MNQICPCKYPILFVKDDIEFYSLPIDVMESMEEPLPIPWIYEHTDLDGKDWIVVQWRENMHEGVKKYNSVGHIVYAGCDEKDIKCDNRSLFAVWHPKEDWEKNHKFVL